MTTRSEQRVERDTFGPIEVPAARLWGAQTQRSLAHFRISGERMPRELIRALALASLPTGLELLEERRVPVEPGTEREPLHGAAPGALRIPLPVSEERVHGAGERLGRGRLVALVPIRVRHADPSLVTDELDRAAARGVRDRDAARQRLDDRRRTGVVHLGVEEDVRAPEHGGSIRLAVPAEQLDGIDETEPIELGRRIGDEPPADE